MSVRTGRRLWSPAAPRTGGGTCSCTACITAGLPAGDWAWTPPSGSRKPGEDLSARVARELQEEVGWRASPQPVLTEAVGWAVFALEVPWGTEVVVDGEEHDRFEWVSLAEARRRCQPAELEASFLAGCGTSGFG